MLIETHDLTKIYSGGENEVRALDGVSLGVGRGELVAVVGSSGSGKSTLLHLLGGLDNPTSGKVIIDGIDIYTLAPDDLTVFRRRSIGFVFQKYNLIPELNVYENITLPLGLDGRDANSDEVAELLNILGIEDKRHALPSQLSGGQQQRVAIARALITKPHIILADEPTGNLDSKAGGDVMRALISLNEKYKQTIILITHNDELARMTPRIVRIEDGRIADDSGRRA